MLITVGDNEEIGDSNFDEAKGNFCTMNFNLITLIDLPTPFKICFLTFHKFFLGIIIH
jgi:hypothetical protein